MLVVMRCFLVSFNDVNIILTWSTITEIIRISNGMERSSGILLKIRVSVCGGGGGGGEPDRAVQVRKND